MNSFRCGPLVKRETDRASLPTSVLDLTSEQSSRTTSIEPNAKTKQQTATLLPFAAMASIRMTNIISEDEEVRRAAQSCLEDAVVVRPAPPENDAPAAAPPPPDRRMHPACSVCAVLVSSAAGGSTAGGRESSSFSSQIGSFAPLRELMLRLKRQSGRGR